MSGLQDHEHFARQRFTGLVHAAERLAHIEFDECAFDRCRFVGTVFYRCRFIRCTFNRCELSAVELPNSVLAEVEFTRSKVIGIDWTKAGSAELGQAAMSIHFSACTLDYSSFFGLSLREMRITDCVAREADFGEADLTGADCRRTDFADSKFLHTRLEKADFREATNYAINPTTNRVKGARFSLPEAASLLQGFDVIVE